MRSFKAEFFKALGHPLRIAVLDALRDGALSVGELQSQLGVEQSTLSQQLGVLRARNLVVTERFGTSIRYQVSDPAIWRLLDVAREIFEGQLVSMRSALESSLQEAQ